MAGCLQFRASSKRGFDVRPDLKDGDDGVKVRTRGPVIVNDMMKGLDLAKAGMGICYTFEPMTRASLRDGSLIEVLESNSTAEDGLFLYFPRRASLAPKLRAFIDTAKSTVATKV